MKYFDVLPIQKVKIRDVIDPLSTFMTCAALTLKFVD